MDRREKATLNRDKAVRLNKDWKVGAIQSRYRETGNWYAKLQRFPAALFDLHGYVLFATEEAYLSSPHLKLGKQISVPKPGISAIPGYVRVLDSDVLTTIDVDIHTDIATEGRRRLVLHLQRERNQTVCETRKRMPHRLIVKYVDFLLDARTVLPLKNTVRSII